MPETPRSSPRILLTGFEPFAGADDNPSARIAALLAQDADPFLTTAVLPVSFSRMPQRLAQLLESVQPDIILGLGEARGATCVRIEQQAANRLDFTAADNDDTFVRDRLIIPHAPPVYPASIPVTRIAEALRHAGLACEVSMCAGAYLCNQMMYLALHHAATLARPCAVGFLHLPSLPTQNTTLAGSAALPLEAQLLAVRTVIAYLRGTP